MLVYVCVCVQLNHWRESRMFHVQVDLCLIVNYSTLILIALSIHLCVRV